VSVTVVSVRMRMFVAMAVIVSVVMMVIVVLSMIMVVAMLIVVMMVRMTKRVGASMQKRPPTFVEEPAADQNDGDAGHDSQHGNNLFRDDIAGEQQGAEAQEENADGMGERDGGAQKCRVFHIAAGADEVSCDNRLSVPRLESMHRSQPECHGYSGEQPSGTQLRLVQKLGQIICVHNGSYLLLGADFAGAGTLRISSKYRSTNG